MCGIVGVSGMDHAAEQAFLGLYALQHRGQEAAGIVAYDGERFHSERRLGLVGDHFSKESTIRRLAGRSAIGHVRYSTTGETILRNVQPLFAELATGGFAVAHNGNLTNGLTLRQELVSQGAICQSTSDTEAILHLVARSQKGRIIERFIDLAGGPDAPIVIIPTAGEADDEYGEYWSGLKQWRENGANRLTVLHTRDRKVADSEAFVKPIREARGVFFGGGRQWRLVDSYLDTLVHGELTRLLQRGGVIGGSSGPLATNLGNHGQDESYSMRQLKSSSNWLRTASRCTSSQKPPQAAMRSVAPSASNTSPS